MNTKPIEVRGSASIWLAEWQTKYSSAGAILREIAIGHRPVSEPLFYEIDYQPASEGHIKIGTAEIVLSLVPPDSIAADEIRALQNQLEAIRAQHQLAQQALLNRISKLQAITFTPEA
jgi:hypothetical protein